jgi:hypothetical protein
MSALWSSAFPTRPARQVCRPLFLLLALAVGGCAKSGAHTSEKSWNVGARPASVAETRRAWVDREADGLPTQTPPPRRESSDPDDPSEPFSPNYGPRPAPAPPMNTAVRS